MKRLLSLFLAFISVWTLILPISAAEEEIYLTPLAEEYGLLDKPLSEIMDQFMEEYGLNSDNFSMCYYATGSGEYYGFAETTYRVAASLYKLPLNMYYYDMDWDGKISPDSYIDGYSLSKMHYETIVNSNNDMAISMLYNLGSFRQYRQKMTKYCDMEYANAYYADNNINAWYMLCTLGVLYQNPEKYADLTANMKKAAKGQYFQRYVDGYEIAHKYGYFEGAINDCGIIYTPDPFLLTAFTVDKTYGDSILGRLCELLTEYTNYQSYVKYLASLPPPTPEPTPTPTPTPTPVPSVEPTPAPSIIPSPEPTPTLSPTPSAAPAPENSPKTDWRMPVFIIVETLAAILFVAALIKLRYKLKKGRK